MVCVIVGCGTRLLFAHQDFLLYFFRNGDEGSILGLGQEWVAINVSIALPDHIALLKILRNATHLKASFHVFF